MQKNYYLLFLLIFAACSSEKKTDDTAKDSLIAQTAKDSVVLPTQKIDTLQTREISPQKEVEKAIISPKKEATISKEKRDTTPKPTAKPKDKPKEVSLEKTLIDMGLVDVQSIDATIKTEVKYSTTDNFMKADAYGDLNKIFLQKEVAEMLAKAHIALKKEHPNYRFIVFDGARPFRVQQKMWEIVKGTDMAHYVARPDAKGSMHNYGCAIDLSIVDEKGKELDMGTPFDFLGALAQTTTETEYIKQGKLTKAQVENRLILRRAMQSVGFTVLKREWWHFNAFADETVLKKYKKIP